mmetsp:Transcript_16783/g.33611  ORF Transcript_16783/g.33611 Transcript_16783/m.33611 type:complete len:242 (-) Transcript_16783:422-1147(-)
MRRATRATVRFTSSSTASLLSPPSCPPAPSAPPRARSSACGFAAAEREAVLWAREAARSSWISFPCSFNSRSSSSRLVAAGAGGDSTAGAGRAESSAVCGGGATTCCSSCAVGAASNSFACSPNISEEWEPLFLLFAPGMKMLTLTGPCDAPSPWNVRCIAFGSTDAVVEADPSPRRDSEASICWRPALLVSEENLPVPPCICSASCCAEASNCSTFLRSSRSDNSSCSSFDSAPYNFCAN